jgi:hypothetical protein
MVSCRFNLVLCAVVLAGASCTGDEPTVMARSEASEPEPAPPDASVPRFIDATGYFEAPEESDAWYALVAELESNFEEICGDYFCDGNDEFDNYRSLRFRCSVEAATGILGSCRWMLGASNELIHPDTGVVFVDGEVFACPMPIALGTDIRDLVEALTTAGVPPIYASMPGNGHAPFDGLADCLP